MKVRQFGTPSLLILAVLVSGCGTANRPQAVPAPVSRTHGSWTTTLTWHQAPVELQPFKATLHITPPQGLVPSSGRLVMTEMDMPAVHLSWHTIKPGEYQFIGIATMAGPWNMNVTFLQGQKHWQATYPINIAN